jgi:hypothetical protein
MPHHSERPQGHYESMDDLQLAAAALRLEGKLLEFRPRTKAERLALTLDCASFMRAIFHHFNQRGRRQPAIRMGDQAP